MGTFQHFQDFKTARLALAKPRTLDPHFLSFLEAKDALNQALMDSKTAKTALSEVEQALDGTRQG